MEQKDLIRELVKRLREYREYYKKPHTYELYGTLEILTEATDTIEDLYNRLEGINIECRKLIEKYSIEKINDTPKILPCPFCGGTARVQAANTDDNKGIIIWCVCDKCNATSNIYHISMKKYIQGREKDNYFEKIEYAKEKAIEEWNKRVKSFILPEVKNK